MKVVMIINDNRTKWSPVESVIKWLLMIDKIYRTTTKLDLLITSMITDLIGRHDVLLPINYNHYNFPQK